MVLAATTVALVTDLKDRMIYRRLTVPVFIVGLIYSLGKLSGYFPLISTSKIGMLAFWYLMLSWLSPVVLVFVYSLIIFWLGILDGGDGQFLIAITPWLGMGEMMQVITYFYLCAFFYLLLYRLYHNHFSLKNLIFEQARDTLRLFKMLPQVYYNIKKGEGHVLVAKMGFESQNGTPAAGMVPISMAVVLSLIF